MKIIHKYIIKEILGPLFLAFCVFTFIFLMDRMVDLMDLIINKGVDITSVLKLLIYILPAYVAITVPMGLFVAVLIAFSSLNSDNEIIALKINGIHTREIVLPVIILSLIISIIMVLFNNFILPRSNLAFKSLHYDIVSKKASVAIQEKIFINEFDGFIFYIDEKDNKTDKLKNITVYSLEKKNEPAYTILAEEGYIISDPLQKRVLLKLHNGTSHGRNQQNPGIYNKITFVDYALDLDINKAFSNPNIAVSKSPREMTFKELRNEIKKYFESKMSTNYLLTEYHKKISIPFACLAFTLIATAFGIILKVKGKLISFGLSIPIILIYYFLLVFGEIAAQRETLSPWFGMWLPNIIIGSIGLFLLYIAIKEKYSV